MLFILQIVLCFILLLIAIFQLNLSTQVSEISNNNANYKKIIIILSILTCFLSSVIAYLDNKEKSLSDQKSSQTLDYANSINSKMIVIDTLSENLNKIKILNDKLVLITEKTKKVLLDREKNLEDYDKLSESLRINYKMDFDSYKRIIKSLKLDNRRYIFIIDSLQKSYNNCFTDLELLRVSFNFINKKVLLSNSELLKINSMELDKISEIEKIKYANHLKLSRSLKNTNLKKFYNSGNPIELSRFLEFEIFEDSIK